MVIEPSNCGKTNVITSLITHPHGLSLTNIYLHSKSLYQPKYEYLRKILNHIDGLEFYTFNNNVDTVEPSVDIWQCYMWETRY